MSSFLGKRLLLSFNPIAGNRSGLQRLASGYRELRARGVSVREAWNTGKSAHGPWRLSKTPALTIALPLRFFENLGLPNLAPR